MPKSVDDVKLRIDRVLEMSLGVAAPLLAAKFPLDGLREGFWETSVESEDRSNGRRGIGLRRGGLSCDIVYIGSVC